MPVDPATVAAFLVKMEDARKACADAAAAYAAARETFNEFADRREAFLLELCRDPDNEASAICGAGFSAEEVEPHFLRILLEAIFANNPAGVSDVLRRGANVNASDDRNTMAKSGEYESIVHFLEGLNEDTEKWLRCGEDHMDRGTALNCPLHYAAACCDLTICRILLEYGARANNRNSFGLTALDVAQARGRFKNSSKHQPFAGVLELLRA